MDINPREPICGILPARLKRIFGETSLNVAAVTRLLDLPASSALGLLEALEVEGWLLPAQGTGKEWVLTDRGRRLRATPLRPRFPIAVGRAAAEAVVGAARAVNQDDSHYFVVKELVLFGSMLNPSLDALVGDVDIAHRLARRFGKSKRAAQVWEAEESTAPSSFRGLRSAYWPAARVQRALRRSSSRLSLHEFSDLQVASHRAHLYRYDVGNRTELISFPWNEQ